MPACSRPINVFRRELGKAFLVPCQKCPECLQRKRQGYILRAESEMSAFKHCYFITLSYNDEHLPYQSYSRRKSGLPLEPIETGESVLCPYDLRLFFERFRIFSGERFSYFACGEYGKEVNTRRPHFHICLWTDMSWADTLFYVRLSWSKLRPESPSERKERYKLARELGHPVKRSAYDLRNRVSYGRDQVRCLTYKRISYVSKYVTKQIGSTEVVPPFFRCSKKLGESFLKSDMCKRLKSENLHYARLQSNLPCALPRFYSQKMFTPKQMEDFQLEMIYNEFPFDEDTPHECIVAGIKHKRLVESSQRRKRLLNFQGIRLL